MAQTQAQVYEQWFKIADEDQDGAIAGVEAVKFFGRSGLAQETLGQVSSSSEGNKSLVNT